MDNDALCAVLDRHEFPVWAEDDVEAKRGRHHNPTCAALHPGEPSCARNYVLALLDESAKVLKWAALVVALQMLLMKRRGLLRRLAQPFHVLNELYNEIH